MSNIMEEERAEQEAYRKNQKTLRAVFWCLTGMFVIGSIIVSIYIG